MDVGLFIRMGVGRGVFIYFVFYWLEVCLWEMNFLRVLGVRVILGWRRFYDWRLLCSREDKVLEVRGGIRVI